MRQKQRPESKAPSPTQSKAPAANRRKSAEGVSDPLTVRLLDLQRAAGNQAVGELIRSEAPSHGATWEVPAATFDLGQASANDRLTAKKALAGMVTKFESLRRFLAPEDAASIDQALSGIYDEMRGLDGNGPLTPRDVGDLTIVGGLARMSFERLSAQAVTNLKTALQKFFAEHGPTDADLNHFKEDLHYAFLESASESRIKELGEAYEKLKSYQEASGSVIDWAHKVMDFIDGPERLLKTLEHLSEFSEKVEKLANGVKEVIEIADDLGKLTGFDGQMVGETQNLISQAQAGFDLLDRFMDHFGKYVPLLGTLWSNYYKPLTQAILGGLMQIARSTDKEIRDLSHFDMTSLPWRKPRKPGAAPTIPHEDLPGFPGGQPVYDFMYAVMKDRGAKMQPEAEEFFIEKRKLFMAASADSDKIQVEGGSHWYDPSSWGDKASSPNIERWVRRHRDTVWAQLYGTFPVEP